MKIKVIVKEPKGNFRTENTIIKIFKEPSKIGLNNWVEMP